MAARSDVRITPETVELRVGAPLQLRVNGAAYGTQGETTWFFDDQPIIGQSGNTFSITAVREQHQGMYRAVVQQGPFGGITHDVPAAILISEPAFVFVLPAEAADATPPSCAICLSEVPPAERFRFRRKIEESYHSGFRNLSAAGTFSEELMYCSHDFHRSCVQSYAEHAILREGRWRVRCPHAGCAYQLYTSDVRELCGPTSSAFTAFSQLKTADYAERLRQVQAGQEVDAATREWIAANCDVCPGCQAIVFKDVGCQSITCTCDARFVHGEHRRMLS